MKKISFSISLFFIFSLSSLAQSHHTYFSNTACRIDFLLCGNATTTAAYLDKIKEELKYRAKYYTQNFVNSIEKINTNKNLNPNLFTLNKNTKSIEFYDDFNKTSKTFTIQSNEDFINIEKFKEHFKDRTEIEHDEFLKFVAIPEIYKKYAYYPISQEAKELLIKYK